MNEKLKSDLEEITQSTWSAWANLTSYTLVDFWHEAYHRSEIENEVLDYCAKNKLGVQIDYKECRICVYPTIVKGDE